MIDVDNKNSKYIIKKHDYLILLFQHSHQVIALILLFY